VVFIPEYAATVIGANGQCYTADFDSIAGYTDFNNGSFNLTPGPGLRRVPCLPRFGGVCGL
jgi:hypothetical protein